MGVTVAATRFACSTSTGNQNITTTDLGGLVPKSAMVVISHASADATEAADATLFVGLTDGTYQGGQAAWAGDGLGTGEAKSRIQGTKFIEWHNDNSVTTEGAATFSAWITNGITINWSTAPATAYFGHIVFFAGSDYSAKALTVETLSTTVDVNTVGFTPDALNWINGYTFTDFPQENSVNHIIKLGISHYDGVSTVTERGRMWNGNQNGQTTSRTSQANTTNGFLVGGTVSIDNVKNTESYDADGFSVSSYTGTSARDCMVLCHNFGGNVSAKVGTFDTPTSTGSSSYTGVGFKPQYVYIFMTKDTDEDDLDSHSSDLAEQFHIGLWTENAQYSVGVASEDQAATTYCKSFSDDQAVHTRDGDAGQMYAASLTSFDATGWTLNFSAVAGASHKWQYLAIGAAPPPTTTDGCKQTLSETTIDVFLGDQNGRSIILG